MVASTTRQKSLWSGLLSCLGLLLVTWDLVRLWKEAQGNGSDFSPLYLSAQMLVHGQQIYNPTLLEPAYQQYIGRVTGWSTGSYFPLYYPPSTAFVTVPLTLMPYRLASEAWFALSMFLLAAGLGRIMRAYALALHLWQRLLILGFALRLGSVDYAVGLLQSVPIITGLLGIFITSSVRNQHARTFIIVTLALCVKLTLGLPFLGLLLLRKQYAMLAGSVGVWLAIMGGGFIRAGGMGAIDDYRHNITLIDAVSINSPDPHALEQSRTDWVYLLNGLHSHFPGAFVLSTVATALCLVLLLVQARKLDVEADWPVATALLLAPLSCLSLLCVYHHFYDVTLLLPAMLALVCTGPVLFQLNSVKSYVGLGLFMQVWYFYLQGFVLRHLGLEASVFSRVIYCWLITAMLVTSFWALREYLHQRNKVVGSDAKVPERYANSHV